MSQTGESLDAVSYTHLDVYKRQAKERCDAGFGVNNTGLAVFLDFKYAIERMGRDVVADKYGNLFQMYEQITADNPYETPMMIYPAIHLSLIHI